MKSISFSIQKGGVGKTSLSGNIAFIASKEKRVLLIDGDPQGSMSSWFLSKTPDHELADVLQGQISLEDAMVKLNDNIFILPTFGIGGSLKEYSENALEKEPYIFDDLKDEAEKLGFTLIVYDVSPGIGRLERCILIGCHETITPLSPEYLSLDGVQIFTDFLTRIRKGFRKDIKHEKLVINMINKSFRRHDIYQTEIKKLGFQVFEVGQDSKIPESQMVHKCLLEYSPSSRVIPELKRLTNSLLED